MGRIARLLKHRAFDERDARRALDDAALARLAERVRASERQHAGEIRIAVEAGLPPADAWIGTTPRQRAVRLFGELRVWDTEHNSGVLVYLLLAEHAIEIVADRGIDAKVAAGHWPALVATMAGAFRDHRFEDGLAQAVDAIHATLVEHFPLEHGERNPNELPDEPVRIG